MFGSTDNKVIDYDDALKLYEKFGEMVIAYGHTPVRASRVPYSGFHSARWLTIKEVVERIMEEKLPDISRSDAIKLAKVTPFSAEDWLKGCTTQTINGEIRG
jgi:hypothetical protein